MISGITTNTHSFYAPKREESPVAATAGGRNPKEQEHHDSVRHMGESGAPEDSHQATETAAWQPQQAVQPTGKANGAEVMDANQIKQLQDLKSRDKEVRSHEAAHKSAAGALTTGGPSFQFVSGPDGKRYAVGGEVRIDTSPVPGDPHATIAKARQIWRAATAPAQPSATDIQVASQATAMEQEARAELMRETVEISKLGAAADVETDSPGQNQIQTDRQSPDNGQIPAGNSTTASSGDSSAGQRLNLFA
ncbi:MAG: hypothetical protein GY703_07005 [Gammaproteobacteria bacterium]|nr:hypothetical protein [Gammaproteobacteria bacterium]